MITSKWVYVGTIAQNVCGLLFVDRFETQIFVRTGGLSLQWLLRDSQWSTSSFKRPRLLISGARQCRKFSVETKEATKPDELRVLVFERPNPPCFMGKQIWLKETSEMIQLKILSSSRRTSVSISTSKSVCLQAGLAPRTYIRLGTKKQFLMRKKAVWHGKEAVRCRSVLSFASLSTNSARIDRVPRPASRSVLSSASTHWIVGNVSRKALAISFLLLQKAVTSHFFSFKRRPSFSHACLILRRSWRVVRHSSAKATSSRHPVFSLTN